MYNHKEIEKKWQAFWEANNTFKTYNPGEAGFDNSKEKCYILDMFPYPSGAGLHVGHPEGYTANDILARYKKTKGFNVLHPMGWDAFGLPAENFAIKTGTHPKITTEQNIAIFKKQTQSLGFSYDWEREVDTTDPEYFKWTQWIFLKLFEAGLAYEQDLPINYCPHCKTGVANEEVLNDFTHERCGNKVEKKQLRQWVLAITKYADRLLADVDKLDWPESIKEMQRNWIGKSEGVEFEMRKGFTYPIGQVTDKEFQEIITIKEREKANTYKFQKEQFVAARDNGKMIAFGRTHKDKLTGKVDIGGLYVDSEYRGKKIGYDILTYLIEHSSSDYFYIDADKNLAHYYEDFGFQRLENPEPFQLEKIKGIYSMYNVPYSKDEVLDESIFMKIHKKDTEYTSISVYTTRIDTVFGMTYAVLAPDHPHVADFITPEQQAACEAYIDEATKKSDQDRTQDDKEKTGVFTGSYVVNPFNNEKVPLWIGDYVLGNYGTGAVMAVPAHDERDFAFAKKYDLPIHDVVVPLFVSKHPDWRHKEDLPTKNYRGVQIIVQDKESSKILILNNSKGFYSFVNGTCESNESFIDSAVREIKEETGYSIKSIRKICSSFESQYCKFWKNINTDNIVECFYAEVDKNEVVTVSEEEKQKHLVEWKEYQDVEKILSALAEDDDPHMKYIWNNFKSKNYTYCKSGTLIYSGDFSGLSSQEAKEKLTQYAEENGFGSKKVNYKLRDWLFSRQRYWGEPIPLIHLDSETVRSLPRVTSLEEATDKNTAYVLKTEPTETADERTLCSKGKVKSLVVNGEIISKIYSGINGDMICDYKLPLELPETDNFEPAGDGNSPLATIDSFVNVKLADNLSGKRETNTMPQWGGSCWYYLRYMDPKNSENLVDKEIENYWDGVDSYVGGAEHAVLHLLYARFWHKFLFDIGVVKTDEPFHKLRNQGLILAYSYQNKNGKLIANDLVEEKDGKFFDTETSEELEKVIAKMSKSLKNVVNPDDIIEEYGADSLRLYEMYMADFKDSAPWNTKGIIGVVRFLEKSERLFGAEAKISTEEDTATMKLLHKTIKKVEEDIESYKFNTAIAALIILVNNGLPKDENLKTEWKNTFVRILHPFAPHLAEELWEQLGETTSVFLSDWPKYDATMVMDNEVTIGVQVMGKVRGEVKISKTEEKETALNIAKTDENVAKFLEGKTIVKEIYVLGKIINFVIK